MDSSDLDKVSTPFERDGQIWLLESYCLEPTCTMINPATGERMSFGMSGTTSSEFKKLDMAPELFDQLMVAAREKHPRKVE